MKGDYIKEDFESLDVMDSIVQLKKDYSDLHFKYIELKKSYEFLGKTYGTLRRNVITYVVSTYPEFVCINIRDISKYIITMREPIRAFVGDDIIYVLGDAGLVGSAQILNCIHKQKDFMRKRIDNFELYNLISFVNDGV